MLRSPHKGGRGQSSTQLLGLTLARRFSRQMSPRVRLQEVKKKKYQSRVAVYSKPSRPPQRPDTKPPAFRGPAYPKVVGGRSQAAGLQRAYSGILLQAVVPCGCSSALPQHLQDLVWLRFEMAPSPNRAD